MPSSLPAEEQPSSSPSPAPAENLSPTQSATAAAPANASATQSLILIILCAGAVCLSFFMPWVNFLGVRMDGLYIAKNFSSYQLVWAMPALAALVIALNLSRTDSRLIRALAGLCPFIILIYALSRLTEDLFKIMEFGAWFALISGMALVFIPSSRAPTTPP